MTTTTQTMTPEEAKTRAPETMPTETSPIVDVNAALDVASDRLAFLGLTLTGMLSLGTAFAPDEAAGRSRCSNRSRMTWTRPRTLCRGSTPGRRSSRPPRSGAV